MRTINEFQLAKQRDRKIAMVTCYDFLSAQLIATTELDCILVGDSAAMVMQGENTTITATLDAQEIFCRAVVKGNQKQFIIADLPFLSYRLSLRDTMLAVQRLMQTGVQAVKLEGAAGNLETIAHIVASGVPVMGHIGLTPQAIHQLSGYRVQGAEPAAITQLLQDAHALQDAGCFALVIECIPPDVAAKITRELAIPTIGIGAGPDTSGQVLVWHDLLGLNPQFQAKFLHKFCDGFGYLQQGLNAFNNAVKGKQFPSEQQAFKRVLSYEDN